VNASLGLLSTIRSQDGVISRRQALDAGLTRKQVDYRTLTGEWLIVHPGVYRLATAVPTAESSLRAASLWLNGRGVLIGAGAAWWWEMAPDPPVRWQFSTGQQFTVAPRPGLSVSRAFLDPAEVTCRRGVRVVTRPLGVLQAAVELERVRIGSGIALIDRAKQQRWVRQIELERAHQRQRGTRDCTSMGLLLTRTGDRAHSELERAGIRELRACGISEFVVNHRTVLVTGRVVELDVAFVELQVALEFDGYAYHGGAEEHRADVRRANEIMASGWLLRRFTWVDVLADPDGFVRTVRTALDARTDRPSIENG
jgi:very-short-patch-repair endonuclease